MLLELNCVAHLSCKCRFTTAALNGAVDLTSEIIGAGDSECTIATNESEICSLKDVQSRERLRFELLLEKGLSAWTWLGK